MKKYLSSTIISATSVLAVSLIAGSANAAGITFTSTLGTNPFPGLTAFDDGTAPGYTFELGGASAASNITSGSSVNVKAAPLGDTSKYLAVQPDPSIEDSVPGFTLGAILYNSPTLLSTFAIYWGSADASNKVEFFNGNTLIQAFTGSDVFGANANGSWTDPKSNRYVTFTASSPNYKFDKIRFSTEQIAFEFDAVAPRPVPAPVVIPGIALAAAFFGSKALKKKQASAGSIA
ncbi:Npun_F0296 family exosortase-dependent surface protein [Pseudanabaena sp. Chao 1811]|uniref:Npun_F0296 family exosortase-dependent surface protein n=1 Tax=Pseudanabaena sp. Chao 1811 TaxID=2963092 RepID=UPI0022F3D932|nr:hypothetical protein [Pseudanabaena sp. Chao 1811]